MAALILSLGALLALPAALTALKAEHVQVELDFFQESLPGRQRAGEFLQEFDGEEKFHVDWGAKQVVFRVPEKDIGSFEVQGALGNLAVMEQNLKTLIRRSNRSQEQDVAPSVKVYPRAPVEMGEPNLLVCLVDGFFPPVLNLTWRKNGQPVSEGAEGTAFYPRADNTFRRFSYLPFVPEDGDVFACQVEHWGLQGPLQQTWLSKVPTPLPETLEDAICILGLAVGVLGIVSGPLLFLKARRMGGDTRRGRGPI